VECWLFDGVVMGRGLAGCVLCWLREGQCLMLVAAGDGQAPIHCASSLGPFVDFGVLWLGVRTCMLKTSECC